MAINKRKVLEAARKYAQKGAQAKALAEFDRLLKLDPRDARLRLEIGDSHRRWGNVAEAIETYMRVAEQYMKEGFDARAVAVYKQIHNLDAEAYVTYEPLAELYQRMGLTSEAILALQTAADGYRKQGKKREALGLLRKMATLDPTNTTSRIKVADLLRQEGLTSEAISEYQAASAELERQGDRDGAANAYERILETAPDHSETMLKLAANLVDRGLADRAEPMAKRLLEDSPDDPARYELMASVYRIQKRDEQLVDTYRSLADVHRRHGDEDKAREILQRFVPSSEFEDDLGIDEDTAFAGMGNEVSLVSPGTLETPLEEAPVPSLTDVQSTAKLDDMPLGGEPVSLIGDALDSEDKDGYGELTLEEDELDEIDLDLPVGETDPPRRVAPEVARPPHPVGDPDQLLAEASVYLRYGKRDQAIANLEAIVAQQSDHRAGLEKLGEAYADGGEGAKAVEVWLRAAVLARDAGDAEGAAILRDRIAVIDADAAAGFDAAPAARACDDDRGDPTVEQPVLFEGEATRIDPNALDAGASGTEAAHEIDLDDIEIDIDDSEFAAEIASAEQDAAEDELAWTGDAGAEGSVAEKQAGDDSATDGPGSTSAVAQQINEDLEEADFYMKQGLADEAEAIFKRVLSIAPNHPHVLVRLGEVAAMRGEDPGTLPPSGAETTPDLGESDEGEEALGEEDLAKQFIDDLSDSGEYAPQDEDALEAERDPVGAPEPEFGAREPEPNASSPTVEIVDPDASLALEAPDVDLGDPPDLAVQAVASEEHEPDFDLAAELNDALDDDSSAGTISGFGSSGDGFAAVFSEFKKGVSRTLSESDHEAHFDLGIAYREMGLLEDAMVEFHAAMGSPGRATQCRHMLGLCYFEQGQFEEAVAEFEQIASSPSSNDEQKLSAQFDLGRSWEKLGERERARGCYEAVSAVDASFCDVGLLLAALDDPEKPEDPEDSDGNLESFEDLVAEADDDSDTQGEGVGENAAPETAEYESFDDFLSDDDDRAGEVGATREVAEDPAEAAPEAALQTVSEPEPEPTPELPPDVEPEPEPQPASRPRKRKKISFV